MDLKPSLLAFALGYGVFVAVVGAAVAAPQGLVSQLLVAVPFLVAVTPLVYWVFDADDVLDDGQRSRRLVTFLVVATLASTIVAAIPGLVLGGLALTVVQSVAFVGVFGLVARATVREIESMAPTAAHDAAGATGRGAGTAGRSTRSSRDSGGDFDGGWDDVFDDEDNHVEQIVGDDIDEGLDDLARDDAVPLAEVVNEPDTLDEVVSDGGDTDTSTDERPPP